MSKQTRHPSLKELEDDLLAMCETVIKHRETYERQNLIEDKIRSVELLGAGDTLRTMREDLADLVRSRALESDKAWREVITRTAQRIIDEFVADLVADDTYQIEIQHEAGWPGAYKLYVHKGGRTIVRVCKIKDEQITVPEDAIPFFQLG